MKRCNNCGWGENPDTSTRCEKCNSLLDGGSVVEGRTAQDNPFPGAAGPNLNRTVREMGSCGTPTRNSSRHTERKTFSEETITETGECPSCGYQLREGATSCPHCHTELHRRDTYHHTREDYPAPPPPPRRQDPPKNERVVNPDFKRTISPGMHRRLQINFSALNAYGDPRFIPLDLTFSEEEVLLSRANVEADNPTISRNQHALLTNEDGKWFLENKSSSMATSLVLTKKHELQPGDIVIIGDRIFEVSF